LSNWFFEFNLTLYFIVFLLLNKKQSGIEQVLTLHIYKLIKICTVGPRNKAKVGKHRIVPYCESFPYCESSSLIKFDFGKYSVIASILFTIADSLISSSGCTKLKVLKR